MVMMETKNVPFELKTIEESGLFSGYGSVFGIEDLWGDVVEKGAFEESLRTKTPAMLWQHDSDKPIGVYTDVSEDRTGLKVSGRLLVDEVAQAREAYALLKAGALSGLSIGFVPTDWEYLEGGDVRKLKKIDLWEISLVTFPANDAARVNDVKSLDGLTTIRDVESWLREAKGLTRGEAKAVISKIAQREAEKRAVEEAKAAAEHLLQTMKG